MASQVERVAPRRPNNIYRHELCRVLFLFDVSVMLPVPEVRPDDVCSTVEFDVVTLSLFNLTCCGAQAPETYPVTTGKRKGDVLEHGCDSIAVVAVRYSLRGSAAVFAKKYIPLFLIVWCAHGSTHYTHRSTHMHTQKHRPGLSQKSAAACCCVRDR